MKLESDWFDGELIHCPICGFVFESYEDYIEHRKSNCIDYGVLTLIKSRIGEIK